MTGYLCISVTLIDSLFHGKADHGEPEWPPSPFRLFQAMLCGARTGCRKSQWTDAKAAAFNWLERCEPPVIVAPQVGRANEYTLFVPNNDSDKERERQNRLSSKVLRPHRLPEEFEHRPLHYLWHMHESDDSSSLEHAQVMQNEARHLLALGWGIDQAVATGRILSESEAEMLKRGGVLWRPLTDQRPAANARRVPIGGTLNDLETVYESFVNSVNGRQYTPPLKPGVFRRVRYVSPDFVPRRPYVVFELRQPDGRWFRYPHRKLIHLAGMVRHLAIEAMTAAPPSDAPDGWVDTFVAGHNLRSTLPHQQLSYLPLPSIGTTHTDPGVRRFMLAAPVGCGAWLDHVARRLEYGTLQPQRGNEFHSDCTPMLVPVRSARGDGVTRCYTQASTVWHSFTPVILPGHDDHKPSKTRRLIGRALAQAGIESGCSFEWSPYPQFAKSFTAHKRDRRGRPQGYFRPDHLLTQTAVHLTLRFDDDLNVPGPLAIGAGRHCGLGLFAREPAR